MDIIRVLCCVKSPETSIFVEKRHIFVFVVDRKATFSYIEYVKMFLSLISGGDEMAQETISKINNGDKLGYLQLIQEPICRMSTISAIFKGFAATIVAGIAMISYEEVNVLVLGLSFLPLLAFFALDIYYLKLERKFRLLYNQVVDNIHPIDYSLKLKFTKQELNDAKATTWECVKSPSIYLFYPLMVAILILVFVLKCICKI